MSKICIGLFGFIRNPINYMIFNRFKNMLPTNCNIDIFITCPNKINEYDDDTDIIDVNSEIMEDICVAFGDSNVYVDIYKYEPITFIKKVRDLSLPDYTTFPIYRVFSQHFSISRLCNNIIKHTEENNINYNMIILTRFDILPGIKSLGYLTEGITHNNMYIWRRCPYSSDSDAEDCIIISSIKGINALCGLYEDAEKREIHIYENLVPEIILGRYLNTFNSIVKLPQDGIILELSPSRHVKYTDSAKKYLEYLLEKYKTHLSR